MKRVAMGSLMKNAIFHPLRTLRRAWFRCYHESLPPHDVICRGPGFKLSIRSDSILAKPLFAGNGFEEGERRLLQRLVKPGMKVMDVGANVGLYSVMLGKRVGAKGHVWSFEPFPFSADYLRGNVARNILNNVTVAEKAVADQEGVSRFFVFPEGQEGYNSLGAQERAHENVRAVQEINVSVTTLDSFSAQAGIDEVNFIKIDVEGAEQRVLAGAEQLIRRSRNLAILTEMYEPSAVQCGCSTLQLAEMMIGWGFTMYDIDPGGDIHPAKAGELSSVYALFMRKEGERV